MSSTRRQGFAPTPPSGAGAPGPRLRQAAALVGVLAALFAVCSPAVAVATPDPGEAAANRANDAIVALDYDRARAELAKADPSSPAVTLAKARLALYEEDCDLAAALMSRADLGDGSRDDARTIADVSRGCARVTAATVVEKDDAAGVQVRFHDEDDRALVPLIVDTVNKARAALSRDLGVEWKRPTRITVVRDLLSLSAMTGLPYKSAQTTGTVAVAKWGRVTILSPRASRHGFPWRDTLTHEMTHLAISMQSRERAPLWLHEGTARREETRWREPGPFDDRPSPDSIVMRGMDLKLDLQLDKLGPSIAMLPSADAAMVAFAEVTSFVRFFIESSAEGPSATGKQQNDALPRLLIALRDAKDADEALKKVSGETLAQWDVKWRANLKAKKIEPLSPLYGLGGALPGGGDSHERTRLAELLLGRSHPAEALTQMEKVDSGLMGDPSLRYLKARILEAKGDNAAAEALVEDPKAWIASYGPCWAIRARLERLRGDAADGDLSANEAIAHDPLSVEVACGHPDPNIPAGGAATDGQGKTLCDAARKRGEPDVGRD